MLGAEEIHKYLLLADTLEFPTPKKLSAKVSCITRSAQHDDFLLEILSEKVSTSCPASDAGSSIKVSTNTFTILIS